MCQHAPGAELRLAFLERAGKGLAKILAVALLGLFLGVQMVEVTEELAEALDGRQVFVAVAEVVLAELAGSVPHLFQFFSERRRSRPEAKRRTGLTDRGHPERIGYCPVMNAARPAVHLGWA